MKSKAEYANLTHEKRFQKKTRIRVEYFLSELKKEMNLIFCCVLFSRNISNCFIF